MSVIRQGAVEAGLRVYSKMEYDDPDESPLEVALRAAVDEAMGALAQQHAGAVDAMYEIAEQAGYIDCDYELIARLLEQHGDGRKRNG